MAAACPPRQCGRESPTHPLTARWKNHPENPSDRTIANALGWAARKTSRRFLEAGKRPRPASADDAHPAASPRRQQVGRKDPSRQPSVAAGSRLSPGGRFSLCPRAVKNLPCGRIVRWCNGNTEPFEGFIHGSNPCRTTILSNESDGCPEVCTGLPNNRPDPLITA